MLDTLRTIISLSRYNIPRPGILFLLISYLKHTNGVDHDMELCACAVVDLCSQLISEQNVMSVSRDKHATRNQTQKQTPGFMDKGLLGDWNSNTLHVRMRNLYPSVPVLESFPFPILPIGTNVSFPTRVRNLRSFTVCSTDAVTSLKLLHLPSTRQIPTSG